MKTFVKYFIVTLFALLLLCACEKTEVPENEPDEAVSNSAESEAETVDTSSSEIPPEAEHFCGVATTMGLDVPALFTEGERLGTEDDVELIYETFRGVSDASLEYMGIEISPHDLQKEVEIDKDTAVYILDLLRGLEFEFLEEMPNPNTGGFTGIHIKTTVDEFYISFNGIIGFDKKGASHSLAFGATQRTEQLFAEIAAIAEDRIINQDPPAPDGANDPVEVGENPATGKPIIYLYPEEETDISVNLDFNGKLTYTYPALGDGWKVTAKPDGSLVNKADGSLHRYLFWEGVADYPWAIDKGFVVAGKDTEAFLLETLAEMGLDQYEINDFITYWVPKMLENEYNLISFSGSEYAEIAKLTVDPVPDTVIRVHMLWKALEAPIEVEPQTLPSCERAGFTLVEWGGTEIK